MVDKARIEAAITEILLAIGEDPKREGLVETPKRVARMYEEVFGAVHSDPLKEVKVFHEKSNEQMVIVKDIPFYSMCEHHLVPFFGVVHVIYMPQDGRILGLSKVARIADTISKKPQLQERLTREIGETIMAGTQPHGTAVVVEAEHLCMAMRGIKKPGAKTVTSDFRGVFLENSALRAEALLLIKN
ncbi:MAG: GTP cyclohydrolase I FolE [Termitinemataceae bacterium]|nr:MAG: GTP cyclohydrolase I FolE [Termitinemataceae bacterium]